MTTNAIAQLVTSSTFATVLMSAQQESLQNTGNIIIVIIGATIGGFGSQYFVPSRSLKDGENRSIDWYRMLACTGVGIIFAPIVAKHFLPKYGMDHSPESLLMAAGALGLFASSIVQILQNIIKSKGPKE